MHSATTPYDYVVITRRDGAWHVWVQNSADGMMIPKGQYHYTTPWRNDAIIYANQLHQTLNLPSQVIEFWPYFDMGQQAWRKLWKKAAKKWYGMALRYENLWMNGITLLGEHTKQLCQARTMAQRMYVVIKLMRKYIGAGDADTEDIDWRELDTLWEQLQLEIKAIEDIHP